MEVVLNAVDSCFAAGNMVGIWAYIDPGTGSLIFQVVAASLISAGLFVGAVRDRIVWLVTGGWRTKLQPKEESLGHSIESPARSAPENHSSRTAA